MQPFIFIKKILFLTVKFIIIKKLKINILVIINLEQTDTEV